MEVLDGILSTGESSRLHQSLVYRDQIAAQASSFTDIKQGPGTLAVYAILSQGKSAEQGEAALRREIARFRDEPVTAAELAEAKNELLTAALRGRETAEGHADAIAEAVIVDGDARAADRRLAEIAAVTPADIQRVARRWLRDEASGAVRYLPEEARNGATGDTIRTPRDRRSRAARRRRPMSRSSSRRPKASASHRRRRARRSCRRSPTPNVQHLANGLTVITVQNHRLPLVTVSLVVDAGQRRRSRTAAPAPPGSPPR